MNYPPDIEIGQRFGTLTVTARATRAKVTGLDVGRKRWRAVCGCGAAGIFKANELRHSPKCRRGCTVPEED